METMWTNEQNQAIVLHGRNLLVSAAAGSGKTAVLVERIIRMITGENPVDADKLLVLTFTRAAAMEMKERIAARLDQMLEELSPEADPVTHAALERQAALLGHASITTIDSFCLRIVRDYFGELDLDPDFRIGEEGELTLLQADCMTRLLEKKYEEGDSKFLDLAEVYGGDKSDHNIEDFIKRIYRFAQSCPYPEEWLTEASKGFELEDEEELEKTPFVRFLMEHYHRLLQEVYKEAEELLQVCLMPDGPYFYEKNLRSDLDLIKGLMEVKTFKELVAAAGNTSFSRKATSRKTDFNPNLKALVSDGRDAIKDEVMDILKPLLVMDAEELSAVMKGIREPMTVLLELTREYGELYYQAKTEKNILDFNDIEHLALRILHDREKNESTSAALELRDQYEEILIDEYQDSNFLQESILKEVSREGDGRPNMFMVGDVKQSIYRFRMARPEIFMKKYEEYKTADPENGQHEPYEKICLARNFRSRKEVLEGINRIFYRIMTYNLGGVAYDEDAALYPGADYPEPETENYRALKLVLIDMDKDKLKALKDAGDSDEDQDSTTAEAKAAAREIKRITDPINGQMVYDRKKKTYRRAGLKDIVILLRSVSGRADTYLEVLTAEGIPACADASGYFDALEVKIMLSLLQIIDNPLQDIPLAAVLKAPFVSVTATELAMVKSAHMKLKEVSDTSLYAACCHYLTLEPAGEEELTLKEKLTGFLNRLKEYREKAELMTAGDLLSSIYDETGYYDYVSAMPSGKVRRMNLDMLAQKAREYEQTSYRGLFHFIRFMEHLKEYEIDFDQGSEFGEMDDVVRICSIHKSKGLEYPIVILGGMAKQFNQMDSRQTVILHPEMGIAASFIDTELRLKVPSAASVAVKKRLELDTLGEELRILYVAMTRAKESLIMIAAGSKLADKLQTMTDTSWENEPVSYRKLAGANSYLDWVLLAAGNLLDEWMEVELLEGDKLYLETAMEKAGELSLADELRNKAHHLTREEMRPEYLELLDRAGSAVYPYAGEANIQTKFSVSELKHAAAAKLMEVKEDQELLIPELSLPEHRAKESVNESGASRGTAFHRVMELLDPVKAYHTESIQKEIDGFVAEKLMTEEQAKVIDLFPILSFYRSSLGVRFREASEHGRLYREQPFILAMEANRLLPDCDSREEILIQGIIDAYFIEDGEIVLIDYKTDRGVSEETLKNRYFRQFELYRDALTQITGLKVKEMYLWSFAFSREVPMM